MVASFEDLKAGALIAGLAPSGAAKVVHVEWFGDQAAKVTYEDASGAVRNRLVYRNEQPTFEIVRQGRPWSFDADGALLRLASEAYRIRLAHLLDPHLAIYTSRIEPLPHQITAVYGEMLPRQPLRFLLADDPGAGKTIMAGLFIKELMIRGDVERCLVVAPGALVEQWQDELSEKFGLPFDILSRDQIEAARTANPCTAGLPFRYAIAEAVLRPSTRCVPVKTDDQLDLQALHRVRSRLVGQRTAVINQIRSFLLESAAFQSAKDLAFCASGSLRFWLSASTYCHLV
jgi:hypothetical protein